MILHKCEWGIKLRWRELPKVEGLRDLRIADAAEAYIEVTSPLDQSRVNGDGPRPWADEPRFAYLISPNNKIHIAGYLREEQAPARTTDPTVVRFRVVDLSMPWSNVLSLQVNQHDDWEGKEDASND